MTVLGWDPLGLYLLEALEEYSSFKVVKGRLVVVDVVVLVDVVESVVVGIELVAVIVVVKDGKVVVSSVNLKQKKAKKNQMINSSSDSPVHSIFVTKK